MSPAVVKGPGGKRTIATQKGTPAPSSGGATPESSERADALGGREVLPTGDGPAVKR